MGRNIRFNKTAIWSSLNGCTVLLQFCTQNILHISETIFLLVRISAKVYRCKNVAVAKACEHDRAPSQLLTRDQPTTEL